MSESPRSNSYNRGRARLLAKQAIEGGKARVRLGLMLLIPWFELSSQVDSTSK